MIVDIDELKVILEKVSPGLGTDRLVEGLNRFTFSEGNVITYNDKISISARCEVEEEFSVDATDFLSVCKNFSGSVNLFIKENKIILNSRKVKGGCSISTVSDEVKEAIEQLALVKEEKKKLPSNFLEGVALCLFSIGKSTGRNLDCIFIQDNKMYSSDNLRISEFSLSSSINNTLLLPGNVVENLLHLSPIQFQCSSSWIHFWDNESTKFSIRLAMGDYPEILPEFFELDDSCEIHFPKGMAEEIKQMIPLSKGEYDIDKEILLSSIGKGRLSCKAEREGVWVEKIITTDSEEEIDVSFTINPLFLSDVLTRTDCFQVNQEKALFSFEDFRHVLTLIA